MSGISHDQLERIADIARIKITADERDRILEKMSELLKLFDKLSEVDTTNVLPTYNVLDITNVVREDQIRPSWPREEILKNAPAHEDGQFKVPGALGE